MEPTSSGLFLSSFGIFILLLWSAFFSGSETALMSSSKARLHEMERNGVKGAARIRHIIKHPDLLLSTILLGNNLVNIGASALTTGIFIQIFGEVGVAYATLVMTLLVLIFAEVLPKTIASRNPERFSIIISPLMSFLMIILRPFTEIIRFISRIIMSLIGVKKDNLNNSFSEKDVRGAIGLGLKHGVLPNEKYHMLDGILDLETITVSDVMVHRSNINSLNIALPLEEILKKAANFPHSRIPVWEKEPDNIIGTLHIKDLYYTCFVAKRDDNKIRVKEILQKPYFVPENTTASKQMFEFKKLHRHLGIVVDEYGDLQGLVTLEDIIEEIVGEIEDEHDKSSPKIAKKEDGSITILGTYAIRNANRDLGWNLPENEDSVSIGGLLVETIGRIPNVGETIIIKGLKFTVLNKKRQAITHVNVIPQKTEIKDTK